MSPIRSLSQNKILPLALASIAALAPLSRAADDINPSDISATAKYLGAVYKDDNSGFKLCPPAGARVINRAGREKMSFVHDTKQWGGNFQTTITQQDMTVDDYMKTAAAELSKTFKAVQVLDSKLLDFQTHKSGRLTASMEAEIGPPPDKANPQATRAREKLALLRQQLIIQINAREFDVLTFYTPLKDREEAIKTFEAMLTTLEYLDKKKIDEQRFAAAVEGKKWLAKRSADELKSKIISQPQLFRMKIDNNDVGYIRFDETETARDATSGILFSVNSRSFPSDGSVVKAQNEAYWAYAKGADTAADHLHYSMWTNSSKTDRNVPDPKRPGNFMPYTFWISETGTLQMDKSTQLTEAQITELRNQREAMLKDPKLDRSRIPPNIEDPSKVYRMMVFRQGDATQELAEGTKTASLTIPDNRPSPLPKILEYLWPRLVDLTTPSEMTFLVYNSATGKPALRTLRVLGKDTIIIDKQNVDCFKLSDELDPGSTTLWVDKDGKILLMKTSDQAILVPSNEETIRQIWGKRLDGK